MIKKDRQSIRLRGYDYGNDGWYFLTICVKDFEEVFGEIQDFKWSPNEWGIIVENAWKATSSIRKDVEIDVFQVMPNHFHCILVIGDKAELPNIIHFPDTHSQEATFQSPSKTVGAIIRGFKSSVTSQIRKLAQNPDFKLWQRNYYERIIRDEAELNRIREYIRLNPEKWQEDKELFKKLLSKMHSRGV